MITLKDMSAPEAIDAAARKVLEIRQQDSATDLQWTIHDVLQEEITASNITTDPDGFEALRFGVFDRYCALRAEKGLEPDPDI